MQNSRPRRLRSITVLVSVVGLGGAVLTACQARPGDAPTVAASQTTSAQDAGAVSEELRSLTVGVDAIPGDINPHLVGSRSLATSVVASLTLPSAFTVAEGARGGGGTVVGGGLRTEINTDLLESATVTSGEESAPTAVRYVLRPTAQWSDGTPVTGADFSYLWNQMTTVAGVTDPAGYLKIAEVSTTGGGRTVDVTFNQPVPDWRDLFADLLPSHIYRSEDRSFSTMMSGIPAASAGVFRVRSVDPTRGMIELERNERYWGSTPAQVDRLVLSAVPDTVTATQMLRTGQVQVLMTRNQGVTRESLASVPGVRVRTMTRRPDLVLTLNPSASRMATTAQRNRVVAALDTDSLARILTGDPSAAAPAGASSVLGEGVPPLAPTRSGADLPMVGADLTPLRIGADESDAVAVEAARRIVDQLVDAGIAAMVVARPAADFYGSFLPSGEVDAIVAWQERPETLTELRSRYGCDHQERQLSRPSSALPSVTVTPSSSAAQSADESSAASGTVTPSVSSATSGGGVSAANQGGTREPVEATESTPPGAGGVEDGGGDTDVAAEPGRTVNVSGVCSAEIEEILDSADTAVASGVEVDGGAIIDQVGAMIEQWGIDVPLIQDDLVIAVGADLVGPKPRLADWPLDREAGPFLSAGQWRRLGEESDTATSSPASASANPSSEKKHS